MPSNDNDGHSIETYKSLIKISVEGMKLLLMLNGGAAVAILAYLGNIVSKGNQTPDMRWSMGFFLFGMACCGLTFIFSYITQFRLYNELMERSGKGLFSRHQCWLWAGIISASSSLVSFSIGSFLAVANLTL